MSELRLGDVIDDHCTRCRMLTNHSVVAIVDGIAAKVECRTCYSTHKYRHGKGGTKKKPSKKAELFEPLMVPVQGLPEAIGSVRGFWLNPTTRILLVVVLSNLGSVVGTFVSGSWIAARLF